MGNGGKGGWGVRGLAEVGEVFEVNRVANTRCRRLRGCSEYGVGRVRVVIRDAKGIIYGKAGGDIEGGERCRGGSECSVIKMGEASADYINGIAAGRAERAGKGRAKRVVRDGRDHKAHITY